MNDIDHPATLAAGDPSGMLHVLKEFPDQCRQALALADCLPDIPPKRYSRVLICGMGGSAIAGDVLGVFLARPVEIHRDYGLPFWDEHTLLIAISYLGNTEETLSAVQVSLARGVQPLCLSSGGRLYEWARQHRLPHLLIPTGLQPRAALAYLVMPLLALAARQGLTHERIEFERAIAEVEEASEALSPESSLARNPAKQLAKALYGRVPMICGTSESGTVIARRWKTQLNENAKQPAFYSAIPEFCHNEIVPLSRLRVVMPGSMILFLRDMEERVENRKRVEILKETLRAFRIHFEELLPWGQSRLGRLLAQLHLGDYVSVYLALLNEVDPTPVEAIERFKERMRS